MVTSREIISATQFWTVNIVRGFETLCDVEREASYGEDHVIFGVVVVERRHRNIFAGDTFFCNGFKLRPRRCARAAPSSPRRTRIPAAGAGAASSGAAREEVPEGGR